MKLKLLFVLTVFCCCYSSFAQQPKTYKLADTVATADKIKALSSLWKEVDYNFVWFDKQPKLDWDSVYLAYIPKILATKNGFEYYKVLSSFLSELKDGHTAMWTNTNFWDQIDSPPMVLTKVGNRYLVKKVNETLKETIPPQSEILEINGKPTADFFKTDSWMGFRDSELQLKLISPSGANAQIVMVRNLNKLFRAGQLKYFPEEVSIPSKPFSYSVLEGNIGLVTINTFSDSLVVKKFKEIVPQLKANKSIILDIRGNGGGNSDYAVQIAKYLTDQPYLVGPSWRTRVHNGANKAWAAMDKSKGRPSPYTEYLNRNVWERHSGDTVRITKTQERLHKQVVVLTSKNTFSAAEDFLIYLMGSKNVTRMGQASAGSSGQPLIVSLPLGFQARICAKRDALSDGTDYIGIGIKPHIEMPVGKSVSESKDDDEIKKAVIFLSSSKKSR